MVSFMIVLGILLLVILFGYIVCSKLRDSRGSKVMAAGLQCYDENSNLILDVSDRITRVLEIVTLPFNQSNSYVYTNDAFIEHEPFVHFPVFNELMDVPGWKPPVYSSSGTRSTLGWNSTLNATYFQLTYSRLSNNSIRIENKFFYGPTNNASNNHWFSTTPDIMRQVPLKVIIGVY